MKILWCDDQSQDAAEFEKFLDDWDLRERRTDVLRAFDDQSALQYLKSDATIGLLILDLLWGDETEHENSVPTGVKILERIRTNYPSLWIVTRSKIDNPVLLTRLVASFVKFRVSDHFRNPDKAPMAVFRKHVITEMADQPPTSSAFRSLKTFLGDSWGVVMFADISGFTKVTGNLWFQNRDALCSALEAFYRRAGLVVTEHGGVIDKFIGDELMAMFFLSNNEVTNEAKSETACRAVDCARGLLNAFRELELRFKKAMLQQDDLVPDIEWTLKIGLEAGSLRILEEQLPNGELEYCAVGPAINFASRIKGQGDAYSVSLGENVHSKLTNDSIYKCEEMAIKKDLKGIDPNSKAFSLLKC